MASNPTSDAIDFKPIDASLPERHDKVKPDTERHKKSRFDEPIRRDDGSPHGQSRNVGDVDAQARHIVIGLLIDEAVRRGHSLRDIAYLLLIARLESGFNPDAASARSSASGVMQITDITADDIAQVTSKPAWVQASPRDAQVDVSDSGSRFNARKNIVAGIIQFERAKAKSLAWAQSHDASGAEARLYQYYHYGLYLGDSRQDRIGLNEYSTHIAPMIDRVEAALKAQARFQVQLKQPDGKGYANALFAAIVPKNDSGAVVHASAAEQQGVPRLFSDLWAQLQRRWHRWPTPRASAIYDHVPSAALRKTATPPSAASPTATGAMPAASLPASPQRVPEPQPPESKKTLEPSTEPMCVSYPLRVQDVLEADVIFGRTDGLGLTPVFTLGGVGEVQFFVLDDDYLRKAEDASQTQGIANGAPDITAAEAVVTPQESSSPATLMSKPAASAEPSEASHDQQPVASKEGSPETRLPTDNAISAEVSSSKTEVAVAGPVAFGALASLYAPRLPSLAQASKAFRKQGQPFDSSLFEYSRSFICKPTKVFEQIAPETQAGALKVQVAEVTASITGKQAKQSIAAVARVTTSTENAQAAVTAVALTPWMPIALKERAQGVMQTAGSVKSSERGRKLYDEIKVASEKFQDCEKKISAENRKNAKQRSESLLEGLRQEAADAKRKINEGMEGVIKLESDPSINNPRIVEYISATRVAAGMHAQRQAVDDEINWCASFVSWCLQKSGYRPVATGNDARAIDWATYGREAQENEIGAIVVLEMLQAGAGGVRTASGNHVGFLYAIGQDAKKRNNILMLGGNQKYDYEGSGGRGGKSSLPRVSITKLTLGVDANIVARRFPTLQDKK